MTKSVFFLLLSFLLIQNICATPVPGSDGGNPETTLMIPLQRRFGSLSSADHIVPNQDLWEKIVIDESGSGCGNISKFLMLIKRNPDHYLSVNNESTTLSVLNTSISSQETSSACPVVWETCLLLRWLSPRIDLIANSCNLNFPGSYIVDSSGLFDTLTIYSISIFTLKTRNSHLFNLYKSYIANPYNSIEMRHFILALEENGHSNVAHALMGEMYQIDPGGLWLTGDYTDSQRLIDLSLTQNPDLR